MYTANGVKRAGPPQLSWLISAVAPANLIYSSAGESSVWSGNGKEKVLRVRGLPLQGYAGTSFSTLVSSVNSRK